MTSSKPILNILCSAQRALLGYVTPNLRTVYVVIKSENSCKLVFYYDKQPSEEEEELASLVDTEFISDFPDDYEIDCAIKVFPYPKKIIQDGYCVYERYEQ